MNRMEQLGDIIDRLHEYLVRHPEMHDKAWWGKVREALRDLTPFVAEAEWSKLNLESGRIREEITKWADQ